MRYLHRLMVVAAACGGVVWAGSDVAPEPTAHPLSPELKHVFAAELEAPLPAHVAGLAIWAADVASVREAAYCPMRTSLCGENPTCIHPKRTMQQADLKLSKLLQLKSSDGAAPGDLKSATNLTYRPFGREPHLATGDRVTVSVVYYRSNLQPCVAKVYKPK